VVPIVQQVRAAAEQQEAKIVISPRATLNGCELINSGAFTNEEIVEVVFGRYRQIDDWPTIGRAAEDFAKRGPTPAQPRNTPRTPNKDRDAGCAGAGTPAANPGIRHHPSNQDVA
jgi:hypothetical protein